MSFILETVEYLFNVKKKKMQHNTQNKEHIIVSSEILSIVWVKFSAK